MSAEEQILNNNEQINVENKLEENIDIQENKTTNLKSEKKEETKDNSKNKKTFMVKSSLILTTIFNILLMVVILLDGCMFFNKPLNVLSILDIALMIFNVSLATVFKSLSSIFITIVYVIIIVKSIKVFIQSVKIVANKKNSQFENFKHAFSLNNLLMANYMFLIVASLAIKKSTLTETNTLLLILFVILQFYNLLVYALKGDTVKKDKILYVFQHLLINVCMFSVLICLSNGVLSRIWEGTRSLFCGNINFNGSAKTFIYLFINSIVLPYVEFFISIKVIKIIINNIPTFEMYGEEIKKDMKFSMVVMIIICVGYCLLSTILLTQGNIKITSDILGEWLYLIKGTYLSGLLASIGLFILSYVTEFIQSTVYIKKH